MLVDDSEGDIFLASKILRETGRFEYVFAARSGEEALELFVDRERARVVHPGRFPPVIIFLDINMPRMNGFEFLYALKKIATPQPQGETLSIVLMLSSSGCEPDRKRAKGYRSVRDYVQKPISPERAIEIADTWGHIRDRPAS